MEILKVIIPASIALVGTIIGLIFTYRMWKRQQETSRSQSFITEKHSAYKELWEKLEDVHVKLRTEDVSLFEFNILLREVNAYILKNSLYLERSDQDLSNQYLNAVYKLKELVIESKDEDAIDAMALTLEIPRKVTSRAKELRLATGEVDRIRNAMIEHFRGIIGGNSNRLT